MPPTIDPCDKLTFILEAFLESRKEARFWIVVRAILTVLGLDWLIDIFKERKFQFDTLLGMIAAGQYGLFVVNFLKILKETPGIKEAAGKALGKFFWPILIALLIVTIITAIEKWIEVNEDYDTLAAEHIAKSDCENKEEVAKRVWGYMPVAKKN